MKGTFSSCKNRFSLAKVEYRGLGHQIASARIKSKIGFAWKHLLKQRLIHESKFPLEYWKKIRACGWGKNSHKSTFFSFSVFIHLYTMFYKIFLNYFDLIEMIPCFELFHSTHYLIEVCSTFQTLFKLMSLAYETLVEKNGLAFGKVELFPWMDIEIEISYLNLSDEPCTKCLRSRFTTHRAHWQPGTNLLDTIDQKCHIKKER